MKKLLVGLVLVILIAGCSSQSDMDMRVVAKAGDVEFTMYDMGCYLARFSYRDPDDEWFKRQDFLNQHLNKLLSVNEGLKYGLLDSVEVDSSQIDRIFYEIIYKREITDKIHVSDEGLRRFWEKFGGEVNIAQILVSSESLADSLSSILQAQPERFEELVKLFSEEEVTKEREGDLGWRRMTHMPEELIDSVFALKPDEISSPIKSPFGYHLIKMKERRKNTETDYDTEKGEYMMLFYKYQRENLLTAYGKFLQKELNFEFIEDTWRKLVDKALALKEANFMHDQPLSYCISNDDLTEDEARMVIVKLNGYDYIVETFIKDMKRAFRREGLHLEKLPQARKAIDQLIVHRMMSLYGKITGLENSPQFKRQYEDTRYGLVYRKFETEYLLDTVTISDEEIEEFYEKRRFSYEVPAQIKASEIHVKTKEEARDILKQLKNGIPWSTLVHKTIRPGFAKTEGNLGYCSEKKYKPIYDAARGLKVGQYGGPVEWEGNWSVFRVDAREPKRIKPLSEVAGQIRTSQLGAKKYQVLHSWYDKQKMTVDHFLDSALVKANLETGKLEDEI
jgi:peptidyl-prolyl cis-trans isomerase C